MVKVNGPVVNGLVLETSSRGRTGFKGVAQRFQGADACYTTAVSPNLIAGISGVNLADWPKDVSGGINLGYYKDARIPAYLRAYYTANPQALVTEFNNIQPSTQTTSRKVQIEQYGALQGTLPTELWTVPNDYSDLMRSFPPTKSAVSTRQAKATVDTSMAAWRNLLKDRGITGAQILASLPGDPVENERLVYSLRTLSEAQAIDILKTRGLDIDCEISLDRIRAQQV